MRRVGVYGWGIVAPRSPNITRFRENLEAAESWFSPFEGFGPSNFLVGQPEFRFEDYKPWIDARFLPNRYPQLADKMDPTTLFAVGAFIQSLEGTPGLEEELRRLRQLVHVYIGTGLGNLPTISRLTLDLHRAQRRWNRFWSEPSRNPALAAHREGRHLDEGAPPDPASVPDEEREDAEERWWEHWMRRSEPLRQYLAELSEIENLTVEGAVESGKISLLKEKQRRYARLKQRWEAPDPPWRACSANLLWNIHNTPASQISMLGQLTGAVFAPVAACSTFGVTLKLAMDAISRGEAKAVVLGASDPPPHPLTVGAFYNARVLAASREVSKPLSGLRGTHVSGGSAIWILGDYEHFSARGFRPVGLEPIGVGVTADADHIITPSKEGPIAAVHQALHRSGAQPADLATWDLHATATPGDYLEVENIRDLLPETVLVSARKGTFGHGMGAAGGWELTAQYLGYEAGHLFPTPLSEAELNREIGRVHRRFVFDRPCEIPKGLAGKLSMGVGGINACVISRPWPKGSPST